MTTKLRTALIVGPIFGMAVYLFVFPREHGYGTSIKVSMLIGWAIVGLLGVLVPWLISKW